MTCFFSIRLLEPPQQKFGDVPIRMWIPNTCSACVHTSLCSLGEKATAPPAPPVEGPASTEPAAKTTSPFATTAWHSAETAKSRRTSAEQRLDVARSSGQRYLSSGNHLKWVDVGGD